MNPITFTAMVTQGERSGKMLIGYPVEVAKFIGASEYHSDEREGAVNLFLYEERPIIIQIQKSLKIDSRRS